MNQWANVPGLAVLHYLVREERDDRESFIFSCMKEPAKLPSIGLEHYAHREPPEWFFACGECKSKTTDHPSWLGPHRIANEHHDVAAFIKNAERGGGCYMTGIADVVTPAEREKLDAQDVIDEEIVERSMGEE